jgi:hypothetical protein
MFHVEHCNFFKSTNRRTSEIARHPHQLKPHVLQFFGLQQSRSNQTMNRMSVSRS